MPTPLRRGFERPVASALTANIPIRQACAQWPIVEHIGGIRIVPALLTLPDGRPVMACRHRRPSEDARGDLRNLGAVLAEQASRSIQVIDRLSQEMQAHNTNLSSRTLSALCHSIGGEASYLFLADPKAIPPQVRARSPFEPDSEGCYRAAGGVLILMHGSDARVLAIAHAMGVGIHLQNDWSPATSRLLFTVS
jgi:hypothetical protein